ncbi:hypothetical protein F5Y16DRAFT_398593 [Xylariaceae sp. FL0255]|nr:hypothetical protein F5Y16DRAFT_398593 [Xylariaceae sp. FL0255]
MANKEVEKDEHKSVETGEHLTSSQNGSNHHAHSQTNSQLFQLPQELRDEIYAYLFFDTRFTSGVRMLKDPDTTYYVQMTCAKNSLSLLRTCRPANLEIGDSWIVKSCSTLKIPGLC